MYAIDFYNINHNKPFHVILILRFSELNIKYDILDFPKWKTSEFIDIRIKS